MRSLQNASAGRPWLVCVAYTDLPADARVIRETREELRHAARVTVLVPRSASKSVPPALDGAEIVWLPTEPERGRTTLRGQQRFMREVERWCRAQTERPDVVHVHNMPDYLYWSVRRWHRAGTRVVVDVHDIMSELASHRFKSWKRFIGVPLLAILERWVWKRVDHVITVHELYKQRITARGIAAEKVSVVLNSPDPDTVRADLRRPPLPDQFKIAFHGTVTMRSGIVHAVNAMPHVREAVPHAKLVIVGTGEASQQVKKAIAELALSDCVEFSDSYVPLRDALGRISDADVGLVPNEVSQYTSAMLPVKLTEYATLGIPVVATALPLVLSYFGAEAIELIAQPDPLLIARAVIRLAQDPQRRADLSHAARRFSDLHGWSRYSSALISAVGISSATMPPHDVRPQHALRVANS